eukprot:CCRYP_016738-RB/>CCRYP_016738-RB protein AED:0.49 eAED:1.00 QI:0/0/0/1/0/0/2/0/60
MKEYSMADSIIANTFKTPFKTQAIQSMNAFLCQEFTSFARNPISSNSGALSSINFGSFRL